MFHPELHLYEGFISRQEVRPFWKTGLHWVGLNTSGGEEISDAWQASARHLLNRIFQKWSPSDKRSTERLLDNLVHFMMSLGSAHTRVAFPDNSQPPMVTVGATRRVEFKAFIRHHFHYSKMFFLFTGIRADFRDFGSDLKRRADGENPRQLEEHQSSCSGPVYLHGYHKVSHWPWSERLG